MIDLLNADAGRLALADKSVHCITTSPPYYSLRRYAGEQLRAWPAVTYAPMPGLPPVSIPAMEAALGLELDVTSYIGHLLLCFRECYRVLRDTGVMWVVMGDSYTNSGERAKGPLVGNLLFVPHRLALALQADGWIVRNDCAWHKIAPMPESIAGWSWQRHRMKIGETGEPLKQTTSPGSYTVISGGKGNISIWADCPGCPDCEPYGGYVLRRGSWRHTRAHEVVLMCVKQMGYWADQEAVREPVKAESLQRYEYSHNSIYADKDAVGSNRSHSMLRCDRMGDYMHPGGRNPRSVLTPKPSSYPGSHYAAFSPTLIEPLIRATCPMRCCPVCGAGYAPVVERKPAQQTNPRPFSKDGNTDRNDTLRVYEESVNNVTGYLPTCSCPGLDGDSPWPDLTMHPDGLDNWPSIPGLLLDPFVGSGTSLLVARKLGLRAVGCDLSAEYLSREARARLELDDWDAWHGDDNGDDDQVADVSDLPLFRGMEVQ